MTAPFAPPPSKRLILVVAGMLLFGLVIPFVRRDDWIGWAAFSIVILLDILLWGLLTWLFFKTVLKWWRKNAD